MKNKIENNSKPDLKQRILFIVGIIFIAAGLSVLGFFGVRKIYREYRKFQLMRENVVVEIPSVNIKAPVLEGTENEILSQATGHFNNTGDVGAGNYCIAGHSSTIYKEYFNNLKKVSTGDEIFLYDKQKNKYVYVIDDIFIVEPNETWILQDFDDVRVTLVTCTDDGTQRLTVVGKLSDNKKQSEK